MTTKVILVILIVLIGLFLILPFVMTRLSPVNISPFGRRSLGANSGGQSTGNGILRSTDGGKTWQNVARATDSRSRFPSQLFDLVFHPTDSRVLFLGSKSSALWKSTDGGSTWQKMEDATNTLKPQGDVYKIVIGRNNPNLMYLAVFQNKRGRLLKSENGGKSFQEIYTVPNDSFGVFDLYLNPTNPNQIIITTGQGGILKSNNGGATWQSQHWFQKPILQLLTNPQVSSEMYAIEGGNRITKTFDGGENWVELNPQKPGVQDSFSYPPREGILSTFSTPIRALQTLILDPSSPTSLYLGSDQGVLHSTDGGFNWQALSIPISPEVLPVAAIALNPQNSRTIFVGAGSTFYGSTDEGKNWTITTIPGDIRIKHLFVDPHNPDTLYVLFEK